ncbi:MAG TPA: hypothetical protein VIV56_04775, partial [Gemmatimonadales bacterium]
MRHRARGRLVVLQLVVGMTVVTVGRATAQVSIAGADAARRAQVLLRQMTLEEKIGQLNLAAGVGLGGF